MPPAMGRWLLSALLLLTLTGPAFAQRFPDGFGSGGAAPAPCVLDKCLGQRTPRPGISPDAEAQAAPARQARRAPLASAAFDFYVLALSWSPGFCDTGGQEKSPQQCSGGRDLGFVVHGLWPQNTRGYPSNCDAGSRFPTRAALESVTDLYPDTGLARHEWRSHGTCTGLSPTDYFTAVRQARAAITIPPGLRQPSEPQTLAPLAIARAFMAANPGLRADTMAVTCRGGDLAEVRLCLAKDLRGFVSCPEVVHDACRTPDVSVLPVR